MSIYRIIIYKFRSKMISQNFPLFKISRKKTQQSATAFYPGKRRIFKKPRSPYSAEHSVTLIRGAAQNVIEIGREFVLKHGPDKLKEVAKFHFATMILHPES